MNAPVDSAVEPFVLVASRDSALYRSPRFSVSVATPSRDAASTNGSTAESTGALIRWRQPT